MSDRTAEEVYNEFIQTFCTLSGFQGRLSYCLMSIHAVNPAIFQYVISANPYTFLLCNMIYGITVMIIARPALRPLMPIHRFTFSLLGSLAFSYSSVVWFEYLNQRFPENPILRTILSYISGRVLMVHLVAFLYHMDTRCTNEEDRPRRISAFESMYI